MTTQRENYQQWPINPPARRQPAKYQPTPGKVDGTTTNQSDYIKFPLPEHYVRPVRPYVKSDGKMDGISTQVADYTRKEVTGVPQRRKPTVAQPRGAEDR